MPGPGDGQDTIAAIATAPGAGAVAIVRISGPRAWAIASSLCAAPVTLRAGRVAVRRLVDASGPIDEVLLVPFAGPRSFTGEDVVELQGHGGRVAPGRVLAAVLAAGARLAEPGEFTRRAMLAGRLDAVQAEAIADIVHASSEAAHRLAQEHLEGRLSREVRGLKERLLDALVLVEASIDFALEPDVWTPPEAELIARIDGVRGGVDALLSTWSDGRLRREGVRVAIVGRPNAGKSSLLNRLLGTERALVTPVAGTTRDWLEESLQVGGVAFRLVDTAGLRGSSDAVEALGIARGLEEASRSDVVVVVVDGSSADAVETAVAVRGEVGSGAPMGIVWNWMDAGGSVTGLAEVLGRIPGSRGVATSMATGAGVGGVSEMLLGLAESAGLRLDEGHAVVARARHRQALEEASSSLRRARDLVDRGEPFELVAVDLRAGLDALGSLVGAVTSDDVLNRIFGDFCIGK